MLESMGCVGLEKEAQKGVREVGGDRVRLID